MIGVKVMLEVKHVRKTIEGPYRCIVVSDIHSHLDRFIDLLEKVEYTNDDYLVIIGDFIEKGSQAIETVEYLQDLQAKNDKVYVILGNCEYALEEMVCNSKYQDQVIHYLNRIGKGGMIRQAVDYLELDIKVDHPELIQNKVRDFLQPYFDYFRTLPTTLHLNNFIFVHAGIENRYDWQNSKLSSLIEMRTFQKDGHCLDDYVVVGHLPTSNQHIDSIDNSIIIDHNKRIISIDGGTGVKSISQLNALIIEGDINKFNLTCKYVQPMQIYQVLVDIHVEKQSPTKIAWPHFEVEVLQNGKFFSICRQIDTGKQLRIKNEFLYEKNNKIYCLDDYIDHRLTLQKGDLVKLIGIYGSYAYVIKDNEIGWIKYRYLKKYKNT